MSKPKRNHFLPKLIQRNFLTHNEENLWVYDRIDNKYEQRNPSQIAVAKHLYSFKLPELQKDKYAIEKTFSILEGKAAPGFAKLRKRGFPDTQEERNAICEFVAYQATRTPEDLAIIKETSRHTSQALLEEMVLELASLPPEEFESQMSDYRNKTGDKTRFTQQDLKATVREGRITIKQPEDHHLGMMVERGTDLTVMISGRKWVVLHAPRGYSYLGSDCPVAYLGWGKLPLQGAGRGPGTPGMTTIFPFARDAALMILPHKGTAIEHATHKPRGIKQLNRILAEQSNRVIFSHSKALLESLACRHRLAEWRPKIVFDEKTIREAVRQVYDTHKNERAGA